MNTKLRPAPHYFIIDSIGGMNEGYSDTTCSRIEDVVAPEYGKAMVEEYIDQWVHDIHEHYEETHDFPVKFKHEECKHGGWHRVYVDGESFPDDADHEEGHTLFIQVYDGTMLGDSVVVYDQLDDTVATITQRCTAIRIAEEFISIDVERIKHRLMADQQRGYDMKYTVGGLIQSYDSLAEVVRNLEYPQHCMIDIDDCCTHFFPTQGMDFKTYNKDNRIITL